MDIWRFAAGMGGISVSATILTQLDKIILSKMLTLEMFGYYTLAGVFAMSLYRIIGPVFSAIFPRLTQLVSLANQDGLKKLYHAGCQFMSVMILPVSVIIAMFSYEIMLIWTQNQITAENSHTLVSILICGTALNGLMNIPYGLQLAHGWTRLALLSNLIGIILLAPMIVFMTLQYGAVGAASVWVLLNIGYIFISIHFMHRRLLPLEKWSWYWNDVSFPLIASILISGLGRIVIDGHISQFITIIYLIIISISTLAITAIATKTTRVWFLNKLSNLKLSYSD
jgi:O-antigen/teichoic acid export membrane protein